MMGRDPDNPTPLKLKEVHEVASRVTKTPAQVLIRYALQRGASVIPKSANPEHIKENLDVFGWDLSDQDMLKLNSIEPQTERKDNWHVCRGDSPSSIKEKETCWLKKAISPLHHKAGTYRASGDLEVCKKHPEPGCE
eukprot:1158345-Pelagomonas_calceolata.AAC.3